VKKIRLSKWLAQAGVASRRACEELIFAGKVKVNDTIELTPQTLVNEEDKIEVNGELVSSIPKKVFFILNKPKGYVCSHVGNSRTKLVVDLFEEENLRLFTVGRLDKDTEGLLIVTNDGHFANQIIHPSKNICKEYVVKTDHEITAEHLIAISRGALVEGVFVKPVAVKKVRKGTIKITIAEGKKREIRVILESLGLKVLELKRIRIGNLQLGTLPVGTYRPMTERDKSQIFEQIHEEKKP